jgi:hypothetical protein
MRGQAADPGKRNQGARALRERGFRHFPSYGSGAGVLTSRHNSMVANGPKSVQAGVIIESVAPRE